MTVTVRKAGRSDAPVLLKLIEALADFEKLPPPDPYAQARLIAHGWPEDGSHPKFTSYLAEIEDKEGRSHPVGYSITFQTYSSFLARPTLYIEDIFILPEHRGKAVGAALFEHLKQAAIANECGRMEWVVLDWNTGAQRFYDRLGAEHLSEWLHYRLTL